MLLQQHFTYSDVVVGHILNTVKVQIIHHRRNFIDSYVAPYVRAIHAVYAKALLQDMVTGCACCECVDIKEAIIPVTVIRVHFTFAEGMNPLSQPLQLMRSLEIGF